MLAVSSIIGFVFSARGKLAMIAVALVAWTVYQRADAASGVSEAHLKEQLVATNKQLKATQEVADEAKKQAALDAVSFANWKDQKNEIIKQLKTDGDCTIPPTILKQLRDLK